MGRIAIVTTLLAIFLLPDLVLADGVEAGPREQDFRQRVQPLLRQYCFDCHGNGESEGNLSLDAFTNARQVLEGKETWTKVIQKLQLDNMPPSDAQQPGDAERGFLVAWIDETLNDVDCVQEARPGRVTVRRLNRVEYRYTIRDLLGIDYQPAADFPGDNIGYGFDNIGDVLSLPPLLMEKYLTAAEDIANQTIVTVGSGHPLVVRLPGGQLQGGGSKELEGARMLANQGEMTTQLETPADGLFEVSVIAFGHQAGDEPVKMALRLDNRQLAVFVVEATGGQPQLFQARAKATIGSHKLGFAFLNDFYRPGADRNLIVMLVEVHGPLDNPQGSESQVEPQNVQDAARAILGRLASRAYRRPVTDGELDRLLKLVQLVRERGDSFETSIQLALRAILVSPHFLFKVESDPPEGDSVRTLNDYELATRLSYFLWSSIPDQKLLSIAAQGELGRDEVLDEQVRRMLRDPRSRALIENFAGQWLQLRNLARVDPDPDLFPQFDDRLRTAMLQESQLFFAEVMREDRSVLDFLDADFTYLNEPLARHYGMSDVTGDHFRRVALDGDQRGGVLTHASVLTITSNPNRTSPVKRGVWILENILGSAPPDPPPGVEQLVEGDEARASGSLRQRLEQHRSKALCASCHQLMDPLGFGFENFDAVGAWRDRDGQFVIDASGVLPDRHTFEGPRELRKLLRNHRHEDFCRCLADKMLTYALGRGLEYYDKCAVDEILRSMAANGYRFSSLVLGVAKSEPFRKRGAADD